MMYKEVYIDSIYASFYYEKRIRRKGDNKMYVNVYEKEIQIDDRLVEIYERFEGALDGRSLELLLYFDGIDGKSLSARKLKLQVEKSMRREIDVMMELTSPETIKQALELAKRYLGKND